MKFITFILLLSPFWLSAQDSAARKQTFAFSGYLKEMAWVRFNHGFKNISATSMVHNRLILKWTPAKSWNARLEIRNRLYWGDDLQAQPDFKSRLRNQDESMNLSLSWFDAKKAILHSNIDRAWLEYRKDRWNIRAGRQRINWGMTNTWNPNDIFNSYNFLDFDYEERAGSDAIKAQMLTGDLSNIEVAAATTGHQSIAAVKYVTNYRKFDLQWNAGVYKGIFTAGFGWAGSIRDAGFKGELQYYAEHPSESSRLLMVMEGDYIFRKGWYCSAALLYNEKGLTHALTGPPLLILQPSPRNLMPARWNLLVTASREFSPLFSGSMSLGYSPGMNLAIIYPTLRFNLKPNLDLDFVWQSIFAQTSRFEDLSHALFLRLKWSF